MWATTKLLVCCFTLALALATDNPHNYYWRDYRGSIPHDAISFKNLYIAQVPYNGALPGALYPSKREAVTEVFGKKLVWTQGIKLLCDKSRNNFYWEYVNVNQLTEEKLEDCVVGGLESNSTLYVGKVFHQGEWKIGKIFPPSSIYKGFKSWYENGDQYGTDDFEILKYRTQPVQNDIREVTTLPTSSGISCSSPASTNLDVSGLSDATKSARVFLYSCVFTVSLTSPDTQPKYYWRNYKGTIPGDALSIEHLYIAQIQCHNGTIPGTFYSSTQEVVSLCSGNKTVVKDDVKILCSNSPHNMFWEYVNLDKLTENNLWNSVVGGTEENATLYIGKVYLEGEWRIGKVFPPTTQWKGLRVWFNNGEKYVTDDFQILKFKNANI